MFYLVQTEELVKYHIEIRETWIPIHLIPQGPSTSVLIPQTDPITTWLKILNTGCDYN